MDEAIKQMRQKMKDGDDIRDAGVVDPENVIRFTDIPYGSYPENLLDVYCPEGTQGVIPTIISMVEASPTYQRTKLILESIKSKSTIDAPVSNQPETTDTNSGIITF